MYITYSMAYGKGKFLGRFANAKYGTPLNANETNYQEIINNPNAVTVQGENFVDSSGAQMYDEEGKPLTRSYVVVQTMYPKKLLNTVNLGIIIGLVGAIMTGIFSSKAEGFINMYKF